jgi:hypothetical protein
MAERFDWTGRVTAIEQKKRRNGDPIEGLWDVTLETGEGARRCSFNSSVPKDWADPHGERVPHGDFEVLQRAQVSGEAVRITGTIATREGSDRRYFNGRKASTVEQAQENIPKTTGSDKPAPKSGGEEEAARWAVGVAADKLDVKPGDRQDKAALQDLSRDLLDVVHEVADQEVVDLVEERKRRSGS